MRIAATSLVHAASPLASTSCSAVMAAALASCRSMSSSKSRSRSRAARSSASATYGSSASTAAIRSCAKVRGSLNPTAKSGLRSRKRWNLRETTSAGCRSSASRTRRSASRPSRRTSRTTSAPARRSAARSEGSVACAPSRSNCSSRVCWSPETNDCSMSAARAAPLVGSLRRAARRNSPASETLPSIAARSAQRKCSEARMASSPMSLLSNHSAWLADSSISPARSARIIDPNRDRTSSSRAIARSIWLAIVAESPENES